ncbi:MAG: hypothetical protein AAGA88_12920 [Pseudomonadota bacterium]
MSDDRDSFEIGYRGIRGVGKLGIAGALVALLILLIASAFGIHLWFA